MLKWKKRFLFLSLAFWVMLAAGCGETADAGYGLADVPPLVERWREDVMRYAQEYGVSEYVELLLAMIAQESGGDAERYPDIMQCSESAGLPPNSIKDPQESLRQGICYFSKLVEQGAQAGVDTDTVIQAYNFGGGYISYIRDHYGGRHSEAAARTYSGRMAARKGWKSYGSVKYVEHVRSRMNLQGAGITEGKYAAMYAVMKEYENVPYFFGGTSKSGIDCSAMSQRIYQAAGVSLPRTAQEQYKSVKHVDRSQARPGDLVFFTGTYKTSKYITHVGVYTGKDVFFHAGGTHCQFTRFTNYYQRHLVCFGRKGA